MAYEIRIKSRALKALQRTEEKDRGRLKEAILNLADNPRPLGCKKLTGHRDYYRIRVGDYRVIYEVREKVLLILVLRIGHRRDIYRRI